MKNVTASEARKHWFSLLDEAARGEVIVVQRKGHRLVLRREELKGTGSNPSPRQYQKLLNVPSADEADRWSWEWQGPGRDLVSKRRPGQLCPPGRFLHG